MLANKILSAVGGADKIYVDDVFSTYLYTGNGSTQTINNGIDLAGKGGMVWGKPRSVSGQHMLQDTARGIQNYLQSNSTLQSQAGGTDYVSSVTSTGFNLGNGSPLNSTGSTYVSWTFSKAPKFFDVQTISHTNGVATNISLTSLGTVGQVIAKITNTTGDWIVWHRSLTAGNNLRLNTTAAQTTTNAWLSVSGTTATLSASAPTGTYVVYGFAHDDSADGIIQCGSYNGSYSPFSVTLGFEPQFLLVKRIDSDGNRWAMLDASRKWSVTDAASNANVLVADGNFSEDTMSTGKSLYPTATGFAGFSSTESNQGSTATYIYLAIRRPNKPPKTGTEVYNAIARTGTGAAATVTGVGFAPDVLMAGTRNAPDDCVTVDRLRGGANALRTSKTDAEVTAAGVTFGMDGYSVGTWGSLNDTQTKINWFFRRAPGFFDVVCFNPVSLPASIGHGLEAVPELLIVKRRSAGSDNWYVYHSDVGNTKALSLNTTGTPVTELAWNNTSPTSTIFSVGTRHVPNLDYVAYLFASCPGISKVGSYTGNGSSQTINCGFTTGARFILIKRTDNTGDWYIWDSARGIVAGNDPHLSLNTTAAEVTTDDSVDPDASGFIVNQVAATNINVTSASYIFLAIA